MKLFYVILPISTLFFTACSGNESQQEGERKIYAFDSRFQEGDSVAYSGQTLRQVLVNDLDEYIGTLHNSIESDAQLDPSNIEDSLLSFYEFDSDILGDKKLLLTSVPPALQSTYDELSKGKDLFGKVAGQDAGGEKDHRDWSKEFVGWSDESIATAGGDISNPDGLLRAFFATLGKNAQLQANTDDSRKKLQVYQTALGQDLQQLTQKFLLGAITFAQATDDYLDEGLGGENTQSEEGKPYSELEHSWDEAFGYFGAARDYLVLEDSNIAAGSQQDSNQDGAIDLSSEYNFGVSVNAAKRDQGSTSAIDLSGEIMAAFLRGRELIQAQGAREDIEIQAKKIALAWEKTIAATCVHYINQLRTDQESLGTDTYNFTSHAKHWSELKGFALAFQFNPRSPLKKTDFALLHELIQDAPVLASASQVENDAYQTDLLQARDLLEKTYKFTSNDVNNW